MVAFDQPALVVLSCFPSGSLSAATELIAGDQSMTFFIFFSSYKNCLRRSCFVSVHQRCSSSSSWQKEMCFTWQPWSRNLNLQTTSLPFVSSVLFLNEAIGATSDLRLPEGDTCVIHKNQNNRYSITDHSVSGVLIFLSIGFIYGPWGACLLSQWCLWLRLLFFFFFPLSENSCSLFTNVPILSCRTHSAQQRILKLGRSQFPEESLHSDSEEFQSLFRAQSKTLHSSAFLCVCCINLSDHMTTASCSSCTV